MWGIIISDFVKRNKGDDYPNDQFHNRAKWIKGIL